MSVSGLTQMVLNAIRNALHGRITTPDPSILIKVVYQLLLPPARCPG
jgi:hypothetical protein